MPTRPQVKSMLVRNLLCLFNMLFGVTGLVLIIVGGIVEVKSQEYFRYLHTLSYASAPVLFISVGTFVFIIACFGCCGAYRENYCMIMTYATMLVVVFVIVLIMAIGAFAFETHALGILERSMTKSFAKYNSTFKFRMSWDHLQSKFHCCGVDGSLDYEAMKWRIPDSCCEKPKEAESCNVFEVGCAERIFDEIRDNITVIGSVCFAMAIVQFIGIIFACCFAKEIKRQYIQS